MVGSVAVVTGVGRNIGFAVAEKLASAGAHIVGVDVNEAAAQSACDMLNEGGAGRAVPAVADVADSEQARNLVQTAVSAFGRVDVLVNNVAITDHQHVLNLDEAEWDRVMSVSVKSVFLCSKFVAQQMVAQGTSGSIVNIGSTSGHLARRDATAYPAAKAAVLNLTRTLALQLAEYGIRVNTVSPNRVGSPVGMAETRVAGEVKNLVGRNGVPADIANAVAFLVSDEATFINGAELVVDGGAMAALQP